MNQDGQLHLILCLSLWIKVIFVVIHGGSHRRNGREKFRQTKPNHWVKCRNDGVLSHPVTSTTVKQVSVDLWFHTGHQYSWVNILCLLTHPSTPDPAPSLVFFTFYTNRPNIFAVFGRISAEVNRNDWFGWRKLTESLKSFYLYEDLSDWPVRAHIFHYKTSMCCSQINVAAGYAVCSVIHSGKSINI